MTKIIAVIIDYKSKIQRPDVETIVVDNNKVNRGFAAGANIGIKKALDEKCDKILLINPDIKITAAEIAKLSKCSGDIVSPVLKFNRKGDEILDYGGKINFIIGRTTHYENTEGPVQYVSGACMMINSDVFKKIGFFDEKYFMYFEDVDFCLRAAKAGFKIMINKDLIVEHQITEHRFTNNKQKKKYLLKSNDLFIRGWVPWYFKPFALVYIFFLFLKTHGYMITYKETPPEKLE